MDIKTLDHLCALSKLNYSEEEQKKTIAQMSDIINLMDTIKEWAAGAGFENAGAYMVTAFVGLNFVIELAVNLVLSSAIVAIIEYGVKSVKE